ncbi:MAG TPA: hypothetical protein VGE74_15340 [Gemmata sp.]
MTRARSLDKLVLGDLMSREEAKIAAALEHARALGWRLSQAQKALTNFLDPVLNEGHLEGWSELDTPSVPGPRIDCEAGEVPLVSVLARLPGIVPYLPWVPGRPVQFSVYHYWEPYHNVPFEQLEQVQQEQEWTRLVRTRNWGAATTALLESGGGVDGERDLGFETYFADCAPLGELLRAQAGGSGEFLLGAQIEFEGNHNDAEFSVLMVRPAVALSAEWLTDTVRTLALQMDRSRDFSALPVLADALQDAGCDNPTILDPCRACEGHTGGRWVVDLVLGKK